MSTNITTAMVLYVAYNIITQQIIHQSRIMHVYYLLCIHCKPIYNYNSILDVDTSAYLFDITFLTLSILMFFQWIIVKINVYIAVYS